VRLHRHRKRLRLNKAKCPHNGSDWKNQKKRVQHCRCQLPSVRGGNGAVTRTAVHAHTPASQDSCRRRRGRRVQTCAHGPGEGLSRKHGGDERTRRRGRGRPRSQDLPARSHTDTNRIPTHLASAKQHGGHTCVEPDVCRASAPPCCRAEGRWVGPWRQPPSHARACTRRRRVGAGHAARGMHSVRGMGTSSPASACTCGLAVRGQLQKFALAAVG
jgi:hypothetical protein